MKGQLLIVDDEQEIQNMLARHFKMKGYAADKAGSARQALDIMSEKRMDVLISDIRMPDMDGVSLLREVRRQYPMTRVIMMTGYVTLENALACMRLHADTCIFKPLNDLNEMDNAVQHAMDTLHHWNEKFRELQGMKPGEEDAPHD
jgi:DNA-binding NtrC family response regulator